MEVGLSDMNHILQVLRQRAQGVPRSLRELNYSLQLLALLRTQGWQSSVRQRKPIDQNGNAIPWYTYSAVEWLKPQVKKSDVVFEYGAGYSTVWYSRHVKEVVAVEHDSRWLECIRTGVGSNVTFLPRPSSGTEVDSNGVSQYSTALEDYLPASFDLIAIDGMERVQCAYVAPSRLRDDGVIIFDNSDRPAFAPGIEYLHAQGFGRIDFYGLVSQVGTSSCTSVFSRSSSRWINPNVPPVFQGW